MITIKIMRKIRTYQTYELNIKHENRFFNSIIPNYSNL